MKYLHIALFLVLMTSCHKRPKQVSGDPPSLIAIAGTYEVDYVGFGQPVDSSIKSLNPPPRITIQSDGSVDLVSMPVVSEPFGKAFRFEGAKTGVGTCSIEFAGMLKKGGELIQTYGVEIESEAVASSLSLARLLESDADFFLSWGFFDDKFKFVERLRFKRTSSVLQATEQAAP